MYCLLCHAKIPRLRAWRTKSEFCSDEHAEAYKNQMLDRLMVNEPESPEQSDKRLVPLQPGAQAASRPETALPLPGAQPSEAERIFAATGSVSQHSAGVLGLGGSSAGSERLESPGAPSAGSSPKEQSAEQALAALRELAESAKRSKGQHGSGGGFAARPASPSQPAGGPALRQLMAGGSEDPFDELRRLASLAESEDAQETAEPAEEEELDVVARASALERLMQEATLSQPDELPESKLDELMRGEQESEEVSDLVNRLTEGAARLEPLAAAPPSLEEASEPAAPAQQDEEVPLEALAPETSEAGLEEVSEQRVQAAEMLEAEAVAEQHEASEPARANVVPFPGEPREEAVKQDTPAAASADAAVEVDPAAKDPGRGKKRPGIPLPPTKVALEPLLDLFAAEYRHPTQQESRNGWNDFVARVQGDRVSLKDVNGVIQTQSALSYPAGPTPASLKSSADLDLALFSTLPGVADTPLLDVERVDAQITGFEAACVHPELVFLNIALSMSQASGLVDVSGAISRAMSSSGLHGLQWPGVEQQVAEPRFAPSVPADFLARCEDLSLSTDVDLFAGDLVFAAASMSERSAFSGPAGGGPANLSGPRLGTAFPDRLFIEAGHADEARGQGWTAGQLVGAGPQGHDSSAAEFLPINGAGRSQSMQESLPRAGIFEPLLETKRPMDRDLADFV